jgi:hypothetical protein
VSNLQYDDFAGILGAKPCQTTTIGGRLSYGMTAPRLYDLPSEWSAQFRTLGLAPMNMQIA